MSAYDTSCPLTYREIVDRYFLEHRAKLLDLAAYLDRLDRAADGAPQASDFRMAAFHNALACLSDGQPERARRVLEVLSDRSTELPQSAEGMKGASSSSAAAMA